LGGWEKKYDNVYLKGRACIKSVRGSFEVEFDLFFAFYSLCHFLCYLLALRFFLLLDDFLELFFGFWASSCASCVLDSKFKLCTFVLSMYSSRGRLRNQVVSTLV
jgi:hypothetical protein